MTESHPRPRVAPQATNDGFLPSLGPRQSRRGTFDQLNRAPIACIYNVLGRFSF